MTTSPPTDAIALKSCPFCGGIPDYERKGSARASMVIACEDCGARVESGDVFGLTPPERYRWNQRLAPEPPAKPMSPEAEAERVQNKWHSLVEVMETIKDPWTWVWNMRCKYLGLRIDTRTLDCVITDRYGTTITLEELKFQQGGGYARFSGTKSAAPELSGNGKPPAIYRLRYKLDHDRWTDFSPEFYDLILIPQLPLTKVEK